MNKFIKKYNYILATLSLSIFIIAFIPNIVLSSKFFYNLHIDALKIQNNIALTKDEIENNYSVLIDYLTKKSIKKLSFPDLTMSNEGEIHFEEVKEIFLKLKTISFISGIFAIILCFIELYNNNFKFLKLTSIGILLPVILLGVASLINFDGLFIMFHKLVFKNDFWIFDVRVDPVIAMLPEEFFLNCLLYILFLIFLSSFLLFLVYKRLKRVKI